MNTTARHDLPVDEKQLEKLAYLLNYSAADELAVAVGKHHTVIREILENIFA